MRSKRPNRQRFHARRRAAYAIAAFVTMLAGLASRVCGDEIPPFLAIHAGDALWAAMIYWLIRLSDPAGQEHGDLCRICASTEFRRRVQPIV